MRVGGWNRECRWIDILQRVRPRSAVASTPSPVQAKRPRIGRIEARHARAAARIVAATGSDCQRRSSLVLERAGDRPVPNHVVQHPAPVSFAEGKIVDVVQRHVARNVDRAECMLFLPSGHAVVPVAASLTACVVIRLGKGVRQTIAESANVSLLQGELQRGVVGVPNSRTVAAV